MSDSEPKPVTQTFTRRRMIDLNPGGDDPGIRTRPSSAAYRDNFDAIFAPRLEPALAAASALTAASAPEVGLRYLSCAGCGERFEDPDDGASSCPRCGSSEVK